MFACWNSNIFAFQVQVVRAASREAEIEDSAKGKMGSCVFANLPGLFLAACCCLLLYLQHCFLVISVPGMLLPLSCLASIIVTSISLKCQAAYLQHYSLTSCFAAVMGKHTPL